MLECGIHWKEIQKALDYDLSGVVGCLVTHSHKDHSKAVVKVMGAGIVTCLSAGTCDNLNLEYWACNSYKLSFARSKLKFQIADFDILPFNTEHDAPESLGFLIQYRPTSEKLLFLTDSYFCRYRFQGLNYIMIECNYIKETLDWNIENGYIHEAMKPRLLRSHFSLENVKEFLKANDLTYCREIILLHLSSQNADADRMVQEIRSLTGIKPKIATPGLEVSLERFPY